MPIEFGTNTALVLTGIGRGSTNSGDTTGEARIAWIGDALNLSAHLAISAATNVQVAVFRSGVEVGRAIGTNASAPAATRLIGAGLQARTPSAPAHMSFRFDESVRIALPNNASADGDEVRFVAGSDARLAFLETMVLEASGVPSFTITAETEQAAERPTLGIRRDDSEIELFWIDPNRAYQAEAGWSVLGPYYPLLLKEPGTTYDGDVVRQKTADEWNDPGTQRFFRLTTDPRRLPPPQQ